MTFSFRQHSRHAPRWYRSCGSRLRHTATAHHASWQAHRQKHPPHRSACSMPWGNCASGTLSGSVRPTKVGRPRWPDQGGPTRVACARLTRPPCRGDAACNLRRRQCPCSHSRLYSCAAGPAAPSCFTHATCRTGAEWDPIFLAAMGSPDPNGRQLNGMGGGISSLSKVCILAPSDARGCRYRLHLRPGADPRTARGLPQQLRQHELRRRAVRGGRRDRQAEWRHRRGAHFQHQHAEDHPLHLPADGWPRRDRRRPGNPGRGRHRRAGAAGLPVTRRRHHRQAAADGQPVDRLDVPGIGPIDASRWSMPPTPACSSAPATSA